ncbi:MAG TPA: tetratricopeptide repeat protein [bacterium]|nr:tetratricopeptide repeat protein [bacterium]
MSPKAIQYKANSIIFFKGDVSDKTFILNSGKVSLNYTDIETGQEIHDPIKTGEFFGVKSALGHYPREETALVLVDSNVISFTVPEFEQLSAQNTRVVLKMLRVFSNQLRRIHNQVQNLIYSEEQIKPEVGLYRIGEYYLNHQRYAQALYTYQRYLTYYPSGQYASDVTAKIQKAEEYLQKYGQGKGPTPVQAKPGEEISKPARTKELSDVAKQYYNAVSLVSQQKYSEAFVEFKKIATVSADAEYVAKAQYEMGRCLYYLKQYDTCIKSFTVLIQKYPKHPDLAEALFFVGRCYGDKGDKAKAKGFFDKILTLIRDEDPLNRKVKKALRDLQ